MTSLLAPAQRLDTLRGRVMLPLLAVHADPVRYGIWCHRGEAKYGEPFWIAEELKTALRWRHVAACAARPLLPFVLDKARSDAFWQEYEEINRRWLPEDPVYAGARLGVALSTTADHYTSKAGASGQHRILEVFMAGEAAASAVARVVLNRPSANGTTPTNQTPEKMSTRSPAAVSTFVTAWSTNPTLGTNDLLTLTFNAFGGGDRFVPQPGAELYALNSEEVSCRSRSGTSTVSSHTHWEEL